MVAFCADAFLATLHEAGTHPLKSTSTVDSNGTTKASYSYDGTGNLRTRPAGSTGTQTLTWDAEAIWPRALTRPAQRPLCTTLMVGVGPSGPAPPATNFSLTKFASDHGT